jgi:phosphate-selective porin OprO/OprP
MRATELSRRVSLSDRFKYVFLIVLALVCVKGTYAQLGDELKLFARAQLRATMLQATDSNFDQSSYSAQIRRFRFGVKGDLIEKKFYYFVQLAYDDTEFPNRSTNRFQLLDAFVTWRMNESIKLKFGQFLMSGNNERMMNPLNQQFVEHSLVSSMYSLERDAGIELKHEWRIGGIGIRESAFVGNGDGPGSLGDYGGFQYVGRLELLPFGFFEKDGDQFMSDLLREQKLKVLAGASLSFNDNTRYQFVEVNDANRESFERDVLFWNVDLLAKWKGLSFYSQYTSRRVDVPVIYNVDLSLAGYYQYGDALSAQLAYLLSGNYELGFRFTNVANTPDHLLLPSFDQNDYCFVLSKYLNDHKVKAQIDLSYRDMKRQIYEDRLFVRAQLTAGF